MRWPNLAAVLLAAPLFAGVVRAHEVAGSRFEAPLPLGLLFAGAGVTVAATAAWLARADTTAADSTTSDDAFAAFALPDSAASAGRWLLRVLGVAGFAGVLWFGLTGPLAAADNPATLFAWAVALKGVGVAAVLFGDPWRWLSPWRTAYDALAALEGRDLALADYPEWLGAWPAVLGFVAVVGVAENLSVAPQSPRLTAGLLAAYAAVMLAGGLAFGRDWFERADALAVLYGLLGRVSPLDWRGGAVALRAPWRACARPPTAAGTAAFVVTAVYTVSFDGFANTPEYQDAYFAVADAAGPFAHLALYAVGLLGFLAAYALVVAATDRLGRSEDAVGTDSVRDAAAAFAPTVVPIAAAYEVAHNYAFVARNASQLLSLAGGSVELLGWLSLPAFWWSQVVLVVAGHILAVVAAHRVAVRRYDARAGRAHLPLVALMVGYTVLSLWIVSRPVVS